MQLFAAAVSKISTTPPTMLLLLASVLVAGLCIAVATTASSRSSTNKTHRNLTKKLVSFGSVQVREYERILGARSDILYGLAIGWNFCQHDDEIPVFGLSSSSNYQHDEAQSRTINSSTNDIKRSSDDWWSSKQAYRLTTNGDLQLTAAERYRLLIKCGFSFRELVDAELVLMEEKKDASKTGHPFVRGVWASARGTTRKAFGKITFTSGGRRKMRKSSMLLVS